MFLWMSESLKLVARDWLHRAGLLRVSPCDFPRTVAKLCLDGMEVIHFQNLYTAESGEVVAEFIWENIGYVKMDTTIGIVKKFKILIDLEKRSMIEATIDGQQVSAKKALI